MGSASWLQSLLSPAKYWSISHRLSRYGLDLNIFLGDRDRKASEIETKDSFREEGEARTKSLQNIDEVEEIIGYSFKNRKLLHQAFTHPSYRKDCTSYERLEYVGDSVLNLLITKQQFSMYPDLPPGLLTPLRAANVDTEKLARVAVKHNFHKYILHGKPVIERRIHAFINALPRYPVHSHGMIDAPKVLADVVESTIGAIFIDNDSSIDSTWKVAKPLLEPIISPDMLETNPVKKLFELSQKHKLKVRLVDLWTQEGSYEVFIDDELRGRGECRSKKEVALNRAANAAYKEVVKALSK